MRFERRKCFGGFSRQSEIERFRKCENVRKFLFAFIYRDRMLDGSWDSLIERSWMIRWYLEFGMYCIWNVDRISTLYKRKLYKNSRNGKEFRWQNFQISRTNKSSCEGFFIMLSLINFLWEEKCLQIIVASIYTNELRIGNKIMWVKYFAKSKRAWTNINKISTSLIQGQKIWFLKLWKGLQKYWIATEISTF